jgi:hypothetical protein
MPLHINFVCDGNCKTLQQVGFDNQSETFGDLLSAMQSIGWDIKEGKDHQLFCLCKTCKQKEEGK